MLDKSGNTTPKSKDDSLNREQFQTLWKAARSGDELDRIIFVCAGYLGMRASEIAHLKRSWIDFQREIIKIPYEDGKWRTKNQAAARSIPYRSMRNRVGKEIENYFDYHERIGVPRETVWYRVKRMAKRARINKKVYPHSLRATAAFQLAEAGLSAQALRQILGWKQLGTAQQYIQQAGTAVEREMKEKKDNLW